MKSFFMQSHFVDGFHFSMKSSPGCQLANIIDTVFNMKFGILTLERTGLGEWRGCFMRSNTIFRKFINSIKSPMFSRKKAFKFLVKVKLLVYESQLWYLLTFRLHRCEPSLIIIALFNFMLWGQFTRTNELNILTFLHVKYQTNIPQIF